MRRVAVLGGVVVLVAVTIVVARARPHDAAAGQTATVPHPAGVVLEESGPHGVDLHRVVRALTQRAERQVPASVAEAVAIERSVASASGADELAAKVERDLDALGHAGDRTRMRYWVAPLAIRITSRSTDAVTVEVWQVGALEIAGTRVTQHWATVTYDLVWERAAWRLDAERSVVGPQPQTLTGTSPVGPVEFGVLADGFDSIEATVAGAER
jgi:hypothetical protein